MKLTDEERATRKVCACGTMLRKDNTDGVCKKCRKSGPKATASPHKPKASPPRNLVSRPARPATGIATICVTEENLNAFWMKLSLEEKANLFQRQLEGA